MVCNRCLAKKETNEFYKDSNKPSGYRARCKTCTDISAQKYKRENEESIRNIQHTWYLKNRDSILAQRIIYSKENKEKIKLSKQKNYIKHRDRILKKVRNYRTSNPDKIKAQNKVKNKTQRGKMPRASTLVCDHCGEQAKQYHHWSYTPSKQLDVIPLCVSCHHYADQVRREHEQQKGDR